MSEYSVTVKCLRCTKVIYMSSLDIAQNWLNNHVCIEVDRRPHSRACDFRKHDHGIECHMNCPTCHGKNLEERL